MEETMRVLTLTELMRLTRIELCALLTRITNELPDFPEGSAERDTALTTCATSAGFWRGGATTRRDAHGKGRACDACAACRAKSCLRP
jgi:hypothetical protein